MGGMKSGTGDVWDDDEDEQSDADEDGGGSTERERADGVAADASSSESETAGSASPGNDGADEQPYVVRRMLKDESVQFERDERLTLFVHDDVKAGEKELEAETQEVFGRDIPVFDIREAVYRAALRNREDVVEELEEMGYARE